MYERLEKIADILSGAAVDYLLLTGYHFIDKLLIFYLGQRFYKLFILPASI